MIELNRSQLIGRWRSDPTDSETQGTYGDVSLEFRNDGQLTYVVHEDDKAQMMFLTFEVRAGVIITNQPSRPREERTPFELTPDGKLVLHYGDHDSRFVRDLETDVLTQ